jgi:hypothetical protein
MRKERVFLSLALAVALVFAVSAALAQPTQPYPIGEITLHAEQVSAGIGYTWGKGTLKFKGKTYPFSVKGINVVAVGITKIDATGDVYNLTKPADLAGNYMAFEAGAALIKGPAGLTMRNDKGVLINLKAKQKGADLQLGPEGFSITMK